MNPLPEILEAATRQGSVCTAVVELTRRCNLRCRQCFAVADPARPELTRESIFGVLEELRGLGALFVTFSGGDPTVSPHFLPALRRASDLRMAVQFFSNGLLLDDAAAEELASLRILHAGITVYGATAETHDRIAGRPGSLERTVAAARRLRDRGVHVVFKFVVMDSNVREYDAVREMAHRAGVHLKADTVITPRDDLSRDTLRLTAPAAELRRIVAEREARMALPTPADGRDLGCTMGRSLVCVNAYGDVLPCVTLPIPAGNVTEKPLREIWESSPVLERLRRYPELEKMRGCPECAYRRYCRRCPGNAYTETGDLHGPSPSACREAVLRSEIDRERGGPGAPAGSRPAGLENGEVAGTGCCGCPEEARLPPLPFDRGDF